MDGPSHFVVPTLALALPFAAMLERLQSQSIGDALNRPSAMAARARGMPGRAHRLAARLAAVARADPRRLRRDHRIALQRVLRRRDGDVVARARPISMREALMARDTYLVAGCAAAGAAFLAAGVLAADVAHALADPRIEGARGA